MRHPEILKEGEDFYYNEDGFFVFTESYHLGRGTCCGNGCKHCPFEYRRVPEPKRAALLQKRTNFELAKTWKS